VRGGFLQRFPSKLTLFPSFTRVHGVFARCKQRESSVRISDCQFLGGGDGAVFLGRGVVGLVERCHVVGAGGSGAIDIHHCGKVVIRDTKVENSRGLAGIFFGHVSGDGEADDEDDSDGSAPEDEEDDEMDMDDDIEGDPIEMDFQLIADGEDDEDADAEPLPAVHVHSNKKLEKVAPTPKVGSLHLERVSVSGSRWNALIVSGT
jgi:hypothetical protein